MDNFEYIEDILLKIDEGKIIKKKRSYLKASSLLFLGVAILYYVSVYNGVSQNDMLSSVMIMLGIGVIAWGTILFVAGKELYVYQPTGKVLKKHKVYVAPHQSSKLYQIFNDGQYNDLQKIDRMNQSNISVEAFCTDDDEYAVVQVLEFVPYNDVPTSPVKVCVGTNAKQIDCYLK